MDVHTRVAALGSLHWESAALGITRQSQRVGTLALANAQRGRQPRRGRLW